MKLKNEMFAGQILKTSFGSVQVDKNGEVEIADKTQAEQLQKFAGFQLLSKESPKKDEPKKDEPAAQSGPEIAETEEVETEESEEATEATEEVAEEETKAEAPKKSKKEQKQNRFVKNK